jgi:hypothetical protein
MIQKNKKMEIDMSKNFRGKPLRSLPGRTRGTCPACKRTGIKLLHEIKAGTKTITVCKSCRHLSPERFQSN